MAFFALLWKARTIENYRNEYEKEKINSILLGGTRVEQTLSQRWRHYRVDTKKRISRCFKKWCPDGSTVSNFCFYLKTDQTFPNFLLKSVMGFVGGIILTYLCFMFFVFQLAISLTHATIMSSIIGVLLTLGLAFSYRIRCLVFLLIPQFFSRVGRYTLTCYALVLILTGPATNTLKNSEVLSESMACSQEQIKTSVHQLNEIIKKPMNAMKDSLKLMVDQLKIITAKVKETVIRIDRLVLSVANSIQSSYSWLQSVLDMCNAKLGTPYERCCNVIEDGIARCQKTMNPKFSIGCNVASVAQLACYTVKPFKAFCYATEFMDEAILASVKKKVRNFSKHLRAMFHVDIHIHHSYTYSSNTSRSASQVAAGIVTEIRHRADPLLTWLSWSSCVTSLFLLLIIFRAKYYQHMFETRSRFDNRYVTKELQELDLKRQQQGRETVLPLNRRERAKYITTSSFRLVASEKVYLNRSAVFMAITTFKLLIHMVADYSLYWVLMTIRYHGRFQSDLMPGIPHSGAHVHGTGFVAHLFQSIIDILDIPLSFPAPSTSSCLPDPHPPDLRRYTQIGVLIFLLWFFALFEPYGLRLRHLIMGHYRPERAKARAIWLFNHILRTRASFMKFARRKLHREYKYSSESVLTFRQWISDLIPFQCLRSLIGLGPKQLHCLLCGITASSNDPDFQLTKCHTPGCPGMFCASCFSDIGELCTICLSPADYGDFSDISLEKGSSDDSDSDGELNEAGMNENIPSLQNVKSDRMEKAKSSSDRRWDFFTEAIGQSGPLDAIGLLHTYKNEGTIITTLFRRSFRNMKSSMGKRCRIKKYTLDWVANLSPENMFLDFSIDENQNHLNSTEIKEYSKFNEVINRTKSIGVNTDRNRGVILNMLVNSFTRRTSMQLQARQRKGKPDRKQRNPKFITEVTSKKVINLKPTHKPKKKTNTNKDKRGLFLLKLFHAHNFTLRQRNLKKIVRSHKGSRTKVKIKRYEELKGMIKTITYCLKSKEINVSNQRNGNMSNNSDIEHRREINNAKLYRKKNKKQSSKPKSRRQKGSIKIKKKNSRHKMTRFHKFFSNHWNNFKCSVIPCTVKNRLDIPMPKVKRNHKRRKKRNLSIDLDNADIEEFTRKEVKKTRNFRISAFLAELEWNKKDYRKKNDFIEGIDSFVFTDLIPPPNLTNKIVGMVQLKNMPFQWREATKYKSCNCQDGKNGGKKPQSACKQFASTSKHKVSPKDALERFRKRVSSAVTPSSSLVHRMLSTISISEAARPFERESSICISKRASVYQSFTEELTQNVACDSENHHANNFETDVLFKNVKYDSLLKNSSKAIEPINLAVPPPQFSENEIIVSCNTRNPNKPIVTRGCRCEWFDDIQKKWDGVTKKSKLSRMKNFCSSLFGPSCSKKTCPHINKREGYATNIPEERSPEHKKISSATQTQYVRDTHTQVSSDKTSTDEDKVIERRSPTIIERRPTIIEPRSTKIETRSPAIIEPRSPTIIKPRSPTMIEPRSTKIETRSPTIIEPRRSIIEPSRSHKKTMLGISLKKSKSQYKNSTDAADKDITVEKYNKSKEEKYKERYCPRQRAMIENFKKKCAVYRDNVSPNTLDKDEDSVPKIDKANNTIKPPKQETDATQTFNLSSAKTQIPEQTDEQGEHTLLDKSCASIRRQLEKCMRKQAQPLKYSETNNCVICKCAQTQTSSPAVVKKITACAASSKKIQNGGGYQRMPLTMRASIEKYSKLFSGSQTDKTGYSLNRATQYDENRPRCCQELQRVSTSANRDTVPTKDSYDETLQMTPPETCTCATQYYAGTHQPNSPRLLNSIMVEATGTPRIQCVDQKTQCKRKQDVTDKSISCLRSSYKKDVHTSMSRMNEKPSIESDNDIILAIDYGTTPRGSQEDLSDTLTGRSNSSESFRSVESKSDTTIYSLAYDDIPRRRKYRIKVVTKSNRATSTDRTEVCDTGTITDDWWSPIVERKGQKMIFLEKKKESNALEKQKKEWRQVKDASKKRIVSFKSRTQIIPSFKTRDVMSPSRYLLESQKYFNELFAGSYHPRAQAAYVTQMPKYHEKDKSRSPVGSRRNHLHRKMKRLDDCYSPMKQQSPRKRRSDSTKTSDSPQRKLNHRHDRQSTNRHYLCKNRLTQETNNVKYYMTKN